MVNETGDRDLAAARLAVDAAWRRIAANQQTLEGMRSRSMALLSVMVVAASIIAGTSLTERAHLLVAGLAAAPFGVAGLVLIWVHGA